MNDVRAAACIDANVVAAYLAHALDADETCEVDAHIDGCSECRRHLSALVLTDDRELVTRTFTPIAPGSKIGRFVVVDALGEGGMGIVWRAEDPDLGRHVALKMVRRLEESANPDALEGRLAREAKALAHLSHPNVVTVYDVLVHEGRLFLAIELVEGESLGAWLTSAPRSVPEIFAVFRAAGEGLAAVHRAGLVHRDFKPDNVLVDVTGHVRVADLGLATPTQTGRGSRHGTPAYMAPEQHRGDAVDPRTDQFAFCVALHEALHGRPPFEGDTVGARVEAVLRGARRRVPATAGVSARVRAALVRGTAAELDARFPSMTELLAAISVPPERAALRGVAIVTAVLVAVCLVLAARRPPSAAQRLVGVWDVATKQQIEAAFLATNHDHAREIWSETARGIDAYASAWGAVVASTRDTSTGAALRRKACAEDRLVELRVLVDLLAHADAALVEHAVDAAQSLSPVASCDGDDVPVIPLPADAAIARRVLDVRQALIRGRFDRLAFAYDEELRIARRAVEDARAIGYRPVVAEALTELGDILAIVGSHQDAEATLREAVATAEAAGDDRGKAIALLYLFEVVRFEEDADFHGLVREQTAAAIARLGRSDDLEERFASAVGVQLIDAGKPTEAAASARRSLALAEKVYGPGSRDAGSRLVVLAVCMGQLGDHAQALALQERAYAILATTGADTPVTMFVHVGMALELLALDRVRDAEAHARAAVMIADRYLTAEIGAFPRDQLGKALAEEGRYEEALVEHHRALAAQEEHGRPDAPEVVDSVLGLGRAELGLGAPERAIPWLERALAIDAPSKRLDQAEAALLLATALVAAHRTPERAVRLVAGARETLRATGAGPWHARALARADALLLEHQ